MVKINTSQNPFDISDDKNKGKKSSENKPKNPDVFASSLKKDSIDLPQNKNIGGLNSFSKEKKEPSSNGFKIKSVHFNAGYALDNNILHTGPMRLVNANNNTDVTITGYKQTERTSLEYLEIKKGQRFAPDEPQFNLGFNATFENNFGIEIDAKHNKILMSDYDQTVHFKGMMNGQYIDADAPLNSLMTQHENTYGNMQISTLGTYTFDLPAPKNNKFSFITKMGPSLMTTATHSQIKRPDGGVDIGTTPVKIAGYGAILENGLRYQFGPKTGRLGLELTHSLSYINYSNYAMVGGTNASHSNVNNNFALKMTVGLYGNKK